MERRNFLRLLVAGVVGLFIPKIEEPSAQERFLSEEIPNYYLGGGGGGYWGEGMFPLHLERTRYIDNAFLLEHYIPYDTWESDKVYAFWSPKTNKYIYIDKARSTPIFQNKEIFNGGWEWENEG